MWSREGGRESTRGCVTQLTARLFGGCLHRGLMRRCLRTAPQPLHSGVCNWPFWEMVGEPGPLWVQPASAQVSLSSVAWGLVVVVMAIAPTAGVELWGHLELLQVLPCLGSKECTTRLRLKGPSSTNLVQCMWASRPSFCIKLRCSPGLFLAESALLESNKGRQIVTPSW